MSQPPASVLAPVIEDLKQAPRDRRIVTAMVGAVAAGLMLGVFLKPTLADRPPAQRGAGWEGIPAVAVTARADQLSIEVHPRVSEEGRLPTNTTLLPASIQGAPAPAPLIRVSDPVPVRAAADPGARDQPARQARRGQPERGAAGRCADAASYAEEMVCAEPPLVVADRRLRQAYDRALDAGASPRRLGRQQSRWLDAREAAAREGPRAVAWIYEARIAELEDMAANGD